MDDVSTKPRGRPSIYSEALAENILSRISRGESIVQICSDDKMPNADSVYNWISEKQDFSERYARAREVQAEYMDNLILEAAAKAKEDPQAARVQIDAYKWRASKLAPKKYGDAMLHKHADADGNKLQLDEVGQLSRLAALAQALQSRLEPADEGEYTDVEAIAPPDGESSK